MVIQGFNQATQQAMGSITLNLKTKGESDFDESHYGIEQALSLRRLKRRRRSQATHYHHPNEVSYQVKDSVINTLLKTRFKEGLQDEYKPRPLKDGASKPQWSLYSPQAHRIMRSMDYVPSTNQGLNGRKGMISPFQAFESVSRKKFNIQGLGYTLTFRADSKNVYKRKWTVQCAMTSLSSHDDQDLDNED
ncbi:hypothetical protein AMTR_s00008p00234120 [Amborella trichopoda]|uniref:Uncharacterized protein n=1 Tax=Amborella trichopoda TaxID=13333 RepID=W1NJJ7_AMBTC|nr:hypothetical protein AMTR_s00008p00234120 [Amborella trichopoda]